MPHILVIDDDVELTDLLVEFLSEFKYKVSIEHSPISAFAFLKKTKVDIILLDIMMI